MKKMLIAIGMMFMAVIPAGILTAYSVPPIQRIMSGALKVWANNETLRATDLNGNFTYVLARGAHGVGAVIVDADVNATAAIQHSKLATPALISKAWARVGQGASCNGAAAADTVTCVINESSGVSSVKSNGTAGRYNVRLSYTPANSAFTVLATGYHTGAAQAICTPLLTAATAPQFVIVCTDITGIATNSDFSFVVWDL